MHVLLEFGITGHPRGSCSPNEAPILVPLDATKIQWELIRGDLRNAYEQ